MHNSDWIKHIAIGLVAISLTIVWAAFHVGLEIGKARGEGNKHAAEYERHAEDQIRSTCLAGQGGDIAECVSEVIKATNEDQRAQYDLVAQTEMARWAFYMFLFTVIMAIITGAGVYYVWQTLKVTREVGDTQTRPWVSISDFKITSADQSKNPTGGAAGNIILRYQFIIENHGNSPANDIKIVSSKAVYSFVNDGTHEVGRKPIRQTVDILSSDSTFTGQPRVSLPPRQKETISDWDFIEIYDGDNIPDNAYIPAIVVCLVYTYGGTNSRVKKRTWASYQISVFVKSPGDPVRSETYVINTAEALSEYGGIEAVYRFGYME